MTQMPAEWRAMQEELGCYGCTLADKGALGNRPCCTSTRAPQLDKDGKCLERREH